MSLDEQVKEIIKKQKTCMMESEVLRAVNTINQQLRELSNNENKHSKVTQALHSIGPITLTLISFQWSIF
jgi:hypothetical protein